MKDPYASNFAYDYPLLIKNIISFPLQFNSNQEIVSINDTRLDYKQLLIRIKKLSDSLTKIGVKKGNTIGVMNWDCHRYLECFFSIPIIGSIIHTINVRLSNDQILYTINNAENDFIIVHSDFKDVINSISPKFNKPVKIIIIDDQNNLSEFKLNKKVSSKFDYETIILDGDDNFIFPDFDEKTLATRFYTTGTTGEPKGVTYSHRQLVLHTLAVMAGMGSFASDSRLHRDDIYMPMTPMFHVHGWGFPYVATLMGIKQVYPGRFDPDILINFIIEEKVSFTHCVPTILNMLLTSAKQKKIQFNNLKMIIGGAALSHGLAKHALENGINVFSAYGMSETCPFVSVAEVPITKDNNLFIEERCVTGKPAPLVELRVVDHQMNDIPRGGDNTGEIVIRSPWLTQGYVKDQESSDKLWESGYMHTGDVGYIDYDGSLKITDRLKDIIKSGGEWISSLELENFISKCKDVSEVAVVSVESLKWGERPIAIIVTNKNPIEVEKSITNLFEKAFLKGSLPKWSKPDKIIFSDQLDKTSVGKINKKLLRQKYKDN